MRHEGEIKEFFRREGNCVDGGTAEGNSGRDIDMTRRRLTLMGMIPNANFGSGIAVQ